jgi:hypothetical protein
VTVPLEPVDRLTVTMLVDNVTDLLLVDEGPATRPPLTLFTSGEALLAEHGFSCLVTVEKDGRAVRVCDRGAVPDGVRAERRRDPLRVHVFALIERSNTSSPPSIV